MASETDHLLASVNKFPIMAENADGCCSPVRRSWRTDWLPFVRARYVLALMSFFGLVNVYAMRVNLSLALVVMLNNSKGSINDSNTIPHPVSCHVYHTLSCSYT